MNRVMCYPCSDTGKVKWIHELLYGSHLENGKKCTTHNKKICGFCGGKGYISHNS